MGGGDDDGVDVLDFVEGGQLDAVMALGLEGVDLRVVDVDMDAVGLELFDDVHNAGITQIRAVFFESKAEDGHGRAVVQASVFHEALYGGLGDVLAHGIVTLAAGEDHFGVIAFHLGFVGEIVRVNADAVAAHKAGSEGEKIPLGSRGFKNIEGIDVQGVEDDGQLIDEGDVEVPLRVFNDFSGFGFLYGCRGMDSCGDDGAVEGFYFFKGIRGVA